MIDRKLIDAGRLLDAMLDNVAGNRNVWWSGVEIVPNYMPRFPRPDTRPACVVKYGDSFLRDFGGFGIWDVYGDDFRTPEYALLALLRAAVPPAALKPEVWRAYRDTFPPANNVAAPAPE